METLISPLLIIVGLIAVVFGRKFFPSYLGEKGKNLATKEDIAEITRKVEGVRHEYNALVEELKARHQLRMASLDRRLQAHQEAFTHWRRLRSNDPDDAILACQTWWEKNCLYLEPNVRQAFVVAYTNEHNRSQFVKIGADSKLISDAWDKVMEFPNILFEAIKLPPLSETESKALGHDQTRSEAPP